jgi:hypothetical protein
MEVPRGWTVSGGLKRKSLSEVGAVMQMTSPDQEIMVRFGDPNHLTFHEPMPRYGFPEGAVYIGMTCKSYMPGPQFAAAYARQTLAAGLQNVQFSYPRELPQASEIDNQSADSVGSRYTAGEVTIYGTANDGRKMLGYCFAEDLTAKQSHTVWSIHKLYCYLAPVEQIATAQSVIVHALQTYLVNPEWYKKFHNGTTAGMAMLNKANEVTSRTIAGIDANQRVSQFESFRRRDNVALGKTDVRDPDTGEAWKVDADSQRYWRVGNDYVVGTNGEAPRNVVNYQQLDEF